VAHLAILVGRKLGYDEHRLRLLRYGAMLHDVGKIGVPEAILNKPGGLTADEKEVMEQHVEIGLRGEDIPEGARILSVVDAFDAITHDRPHRAGNSVEAALEELRQEAGRQFDPRLVDVLTEVLREGEWLLAEPFLQTPAALRVAAG
jgi:HD-GYP domain-containing protein (c-di-GMP phosphodiesterase class II)